MLHYYFFKYWSRGLVGLMVTIVVSYFGIFSYSLVAAQNTERETALEAAAQLSATPPLKIVDSTKTYQQSLKVFEGIQKLKDSNQDTTKLESMYAESVKSLSNQNEEEAASQLKEIASEIAKINDSLTGTPTLEPSGILLSGTPSPSVSPLPSGGDEVKLATQSAAED